MDERLPEGVTPRGLELTEAMFTGECELAGACEDTMDDDDVLGRAVAGGEGARVFMAGRRGCHPWGQGGETSRVQGEEKRARVEGGAHATPRPAELAVPLAALWWRSMQSRRRPAVMPALGWVHQQRPGARTIRLPLHGPGHAQIDALAPANPDLPHHACSAYPTRRPAVHQRTFQRSFLACADFASSRLGAYRRAPAAALT